MDLPGESYERAGCQVLEARGTVLAASGAWHKDL
jgi:hypothetical protein